MRPLEVASLNRDETLRHQSIRLLSPLRHLPTFPLAGRRIDRKQRNMMVLAICLRELRDHTPV